MSGRWLKGSEKNKPGEPRGTVYGVSKHANMRFMKCRIETN